MNYKIKVVYQTGDTFRSHETEDVLDFSWSNIDIAKKNLKHINEHYKLYMMIDKDWNLGREEQNVKILEASKKPWFYNKEKQYWKYQIGLEKDDGTIEFISTSWCGYFESLWSAEIIIEEDKDNDMKISYR